MIAGGFYQKTMMKKTMVLRGAPGLVFDKAPFVTLLCLACGSVCSQEAQTTKKLFDFFSPGSGGASSSSVQADAGLATCGDCYCIPDSEEGCPETRPQTNFTAMLPNLKAMEHDNPVQLNCNPYQDEACDTVPALQEGGACVIEYSKPLVAPNLRCPSTWSYQLETYPGTVAQAVAEGKRVTHQGACGTCSSLQDLAVYMEFPDLTEEGSLCYLAGAGNITAGITCFEALGFTTPCATTWVYTTRKTARECWFVCWMQRLVQLPNNGRAPTCRLARCLQCDERESGPIFKPFSGRTRRNSNLLSLIARPCASLSSNITHQDPCET